LYDTFGKVAVAEESARRIDSVDAAGFVRPKLAGRPGGPVGSPPIAVGDGGVSGLRAADQEAATIGGDPWGLPVDNGESVFPYPDSGPIGYDRASWPRP
jgi:hypothetical protein